MTPHIHDMNIYHDIAVSICDWLCENPPRLYAYFDPFLQFSVQNAITFT